MMLRFQGVVFAAIAVVVVVITFAGISGIGKASRIVRRSTILTAQRS